MLWVTIFCEQHSLRVITCNEVVIKNGNIHQMCPVQVVCCKGLTQTRHLVPNKATLSLLCLLSAWITVAHFPTQCFISFPVSFEMILSQRNHICPEAKTIIITSDSICGKCLHKLHNLAIDEYSSSPLFLIQA